MKYLQIFLLCLLLLSGCISNKVVKINQYCEDISWHGTGIVISENKIMTVAHVVNKGDSCTVEVNDWFRRRVTCVKSQYIHKGDREPIVILKPDDEYRFAKKNILRIGFGNIPYKVITLRGTFLWDKYLPKKGDSGSAVINKYENLIGIIYGRIGTRPIFFSVNGDIWKSM